MRVGVVVCRVAVTAVHVRRMQVVPVRVRTRRVQSAGVLVVVERASKRVVTLDNRGVLQTQCKQSIRKHQHSHVNHE